MAKDRAIISIIVLFFAVSSSFKSPKDIVAENLDNLFANPTGFINWFNKRDSVLSMNSTTSSRATHHSGSVNETAGKSGRKIYIMRHGERVDFTFGSWIYHSFEKDGRYIQKDLNMPETLIERPNGIMSWNKDSPLTNVGLLQAKLIGRALKRANVSNIRAVYCSPSYRCIQTCHGVLEGLELNHQVPINIEPGLFEFLQWYQDELPDFLSPDHLKESGFNVNTTYQPYVPVTAFKDLVTENLTEFYQRNSLVVENALQSLPGEGNLLIVGHATTLDTCSRLVMRKPMRTTADVSRVMHKVPYCSLITLEEVEKDKWQLIEPPIAPLMHTNNGRFDWTVFDD